MMSKYLTEDNILVGPDLVFEPAKGGLGYELFQALKQNKGKCAQHLLLTGETLSYDDLLIRSVRTAIFLGKKNLKKNDIICLCSPNNIHILVTAIASKFVDVQYAAMEPTQSMDDIVHLLKLLQPKLLFVAENGISKMEEAIQKSNLECEVISLGDDPSKYTTISQLFSPTKEEETYNPKFVEDTKETAFIFLSSGTTGKPKGVCLNHYSLLAYTYILARKFHHKGKISFSNFSEEFTIGKHSILHYSPLYWISGFLFNMATIFCGGTLMLGSNFDGASAWKAFKTYKPDSVFLPPGQVNDLCSYGSSDEPIVGVTAFSTGGGPVTTTHIKDLKKCFPTTRVSQIYGQTENSGPITITDCLSREEIEHEETNFSSCGRLANGMRMRAVDVDTGKACGPGVPGELRIKSKCIMNGYYKMDSSFLFDSEGWMTTGDLGYFDEKGYVYVIDRIKDLLLYTIYNISPSVIENVLKQHPAVFECCVVGKPHLRDNEHPMGIVVLREGYDDSIEEEIISFVNDRVPADRYKIRAGIKFVKEMLKTHTGKLKKLEMKRLISEGKLF